MTTQTLTPALERPSLPRRWLAGWGSVLLLITSALTSIGAMVLVSLVLTAVLLISAGGLGLLLLVPLVWLCGVVGHAERHRVVALSGRRVDPPARRVQPLWRRLLFDQHAWRSTAYLALHGLWGTFMGWLTLLVLAQAVGSVVTGSLALLTDTAHALADSVGLLVALVALGAVIALVSSRKR